MRTDLPLTPCEVEICELIERGYTNKKIAHMLGIQVATVKNHVHNILHKLQITTRGEAARYTRDPGLLRIRANRRSG